MKYEFEVTLKYGDNLRREVVEADRRLIIYGIYALDSVEQELQSCISKMYRDMCGEIIVERAEENV